MVLCSKGLNPAWASNKRLNVKQAQCQEAHVRFAVGDQFFLEIKHYLFVALLLMPLFQGFLGFRGHGFGHVVVEGRDGSHVRLVFGLLN